MTFRNDQRYTCRTCNNSGMGDPRNWHHYLHMFTMTGGLGEPELENSSPPAPGSDPVLRVALIRAGVLNERDIRDAETILGIRPPEKPAASRTDVTTATDAQPRHSARTEPLGGLMDTTPRHREAVIHAGKRLGLRDPKNHVAIYFGDVWTGHVPVHPVSVEHTDDAGPWQMLGNDEWGDCGPVSVANLTALITKVLGGTQHYPSLDDVLDLYKRSGNPNFPDDDNGVDMQTMLEELVRNGINCNGSVIKPLAFAKLDVHNIDEVRAAIAIFGGVLLGLNLEVAQQRQSNVWDYVESTEWGGHAVMAADYTSLTGAGQPDIGWVTWSEIVEATDAFWDHQAMEAWVVIFSEHLGTRQFQEGVDLNALKSDYEALTGRPFPDVAPKPSPTPPDLASAVLRFLTPDIVAWAKVHQSSHHMAETRRVSRAILQLMEDSGYAQP